MDPCSLSWIASHFMLTCKTFDYLMMLLLCLSHHSTQRTFTHTHKKATTTTTTTKYIYIYIYIYIYLFHPRYLHNDIFRYVTYTHTYHENYIESQLAWQHSWYICVCWSDKELIFSLRLLRAFIGPELNHHCALPKYNLMMWYNILISLNHYSDRFVLSLYVADSCKLNLPTNVDNCKHS